VTAAPRNAHHDSRHRGDRPSSSLSGGGLELRIDDRHSIRLELADGRVRVVARIGSMTSILSEVPHDTGPHLEVRVERSGGPVLSARLSAAEELAEMVRRDGCLAIGHASSRRMFTEAAVGMSGWSVGLVTPAGTAFVRSISHTSAGDPTAPLAGAPVPKNLEN
jgi:xylan 1,4-beta-xylosidase